MHIQNLKQMLNKMEKEYNEKPAFKYKTDKEGIFDIITYKKFKDDIDGMGTALIDMGLKGKRIAVIGENRYEWCVSYLAISCGVGIVVPLDKSLPEIEIMNLIQRSEVEGIIYSKKYDETMKKIRDNNPKFLKKFISMDLVENTQEENSLKQIMKDGKSLVEKGNKEYINAEINNEDMTFMLFTSGTTEMAKAVALSHKNICSEIEGISEVIKIGPNDTLLSFLPLHHTFECTVGFVYPISQGASIAFCDGIRHLAENIREYQITAMISVPILYENMYKKLIKGIEKQGKLEKVNKAIKISNFLLKFKIDLRKRLFKDIHAVLGGKVRVFVSGAAALDPKVEQGFNDLGFRISQGYGLTECSPVIAAGNDKCRKIGSVGVALPGVEVQIIDKNEQGIGEIIAKGPNVMIEYYGNKLATEKTLVDGWIHTGDLGYLDKDGCLYITGRKKNVIILKNGKNVYPEELETLINRIPGIKESFVYGKVESDNDPVICAKLVYNPDEISSEYNVEGEDEISKLLWEKIKEINKTMPTYKYIRELIVTTEDLIKTTTEKVKRHEELAKILNKGE